MKRLSFLLPVLGLALLAGSARADDEPGYMGVQIKGTPDNTGVIIVMVFKDSPAQAAELMADDVITKIDGQDVTTIRDFVNRIRNTKPDTKVKLTVNRSGQDKEIEVKVGKKPDEE
jgi:S1-C subfamily serine protease